MASVITKFAHLQIPLGDVLKATNDFHHDNIISQGGFGPAYKGQLLRSGELIKIAARRLDRKRGLGDSEFWTEVSMLSNLKHTNLVSLIGFCDEKDEKVIITTFEANGSLGQFLNSPDLTWTQRLKICIGVARALRYLHSYEGRGYAVIHRFINNSTILLDENFEAKLSGFEISIKQSVHQKNRVFLCDPVGVVEYLDPAIKETKGVTYKSDIYSFGVVLFEILCGRKAFIPNGPHRFLPSLAKYHYENKILHDIIHHNLWNQMSFQSLVIYSDVAYSCLKERTHRPDSTNIICELEDALEFQIRYENIGNNLEHMKIPLTHIQLATEDFSETHKIMSVYDDDDDDNDDGCYTLYRAELDHYYKENHSSVQCENKDEHTKRRNTVVIKRCQKGHDAYGEEEYLTEIEMLNIVKHPNIVTLLGFCIEGSEMILVTENVSNGYLSDHLGNDTPCILTWEKRLKICIDVAHALNYLHSEMEDQNMIINRDICSHNIGLDHNWGAKIVEFGDSVFLPPNQENNALYIDWVGRRTYIDPEYEMTDKLKRESDVYSFGVVLFELLCGRASYDPVYNKESEKGLAHVARQSFCKGTIENMIDPILKEENNILLHRGPNKDSLDTFIEIAYQCIAETQDQRPTMKIVVKKLEKALFLQEEGIQRPFTDQVLNKLEKLPLTRETTEERLQRPNTYQIVDKHEKYRFAYEIQGNNLKHLNICLSDIKSATNNFSETCRISSDDVDYTLYRAELEHFDKENSSSVQGKNGGEHPKRRNTMVIKRYPKGHKLYNQEKYFTEIEMLSCVKHPNIVTLLGFCVEDSEMILVTDNVSNGYLDDYLGNINNDKRRILTWETRLKICIDVAHALNYLHSEMEDRKMIIHRDINRCSIGLGENFRAKIVDFWFSVFLPTNQENKALYLNYIGTVSYTDPEYRMTNKLKRESDVYSFGVVLFEILFGRAANDPTYIKESDKGLAHVARQSFCKRTLEDKIDNILKEEACENNFVLNGGPNKDSLDIFIGIAYHCVTETQDQRPTMKVVVKELEKALFFQNNNKDNPKISLEDIKMATNNFHDNNYVGGGGFGRVHKGNLQDGDGFKTIVAKRLDKKSRQGEQQFFTELQILLEYKHENVIGLVGYCNEKDDKIIVYEYAPRRSLDRYLNDASLTWVKRLNICIDVARALDFLHGRLGKQAKVIHRDIKSANILLNIDWKAKLADFGLSLVSPLIQDIDYVIDRACGTPGYVDPLYYQSGFLTIESDVYSFGVVLFEILCGRSMFEFQKHKGHYLPDFIKSIAEEGKHDDLVFELIREQLMPRSLTTFLEVAYQCLHHDREKRPSTKYVLMQLKKALEFQSMASTMTKFAPFLIPLEDVVMATNNFHGDKIIGQDGSSTAYKGHLLQSGRLMNIVARRFDSKYGERDLEFLTELSMLSDLKNTNLVSFIGFCDEKDEKIILITYEANGNLKQYLNSWNLTWTQRLRICVGLAQALSYLHYDEGRDYSIIHCNINSDTILLNENWEAKLSGFEISIKKSVYDLEEDCVCEHFNIMGCVDPITDKTGGVTHKSDIYSFGVVLFEILCGRKAYIQKEANRFLAPLVVHHYENATLQDIIHHDLWNQMSPQSLLEYSRVAYSCLKEERTLRPNAHNIVNTLEKALESHLHHEHSGKKFQHLWIRLSDIKSATNNFSETFKIASTDGCTMYRAELQHFDKENISSLQGKKGGEHPKTRSTVVIKRYPKGHKLYSEEKYFTEIEMLSCVKHPNIVTLLGFYVKDSEMILVTENVSNGYLADYLGNDTSCILTWEKRLKICIDAAHALNYLHSEMEDQKRIIHRDICSYSIGLDNTWGAKIVDFWWSVFLPPNQEDEALHLDWIGRTFNGDPEYEMTGKLKRASDVYSFGVVLFEILCGRLAFDPIYKKESAYGLAAVARRSFFSGTLQDIIDPMLKDETGKPNKDSLDTFIEIAHHCVAETQDQRPTMKVVLKELEKALSFQKNKDNHRISFEDINQATRNFHNDNCIGRGRFGGVFLGTFQDGDGFKTIVAKKLDTRFGQGEQQFLNELQILLEYKHENVIGLVGYCDEKDEKVIVSEYAARGSLDRYLNDGSLTWVKRLNICIEVANALYFLHGGVGKQAKVIHKDIKTANILLNHDWKAKLVGFGLSLISPLIQETDYDIDGACGTHGYVDPLYYKSGFLTIESDVYSFGVVLFEILCGISTCAIKKHEGHYLSDFVKSRFEEGKLDEVVFEQIKEHIMPKSLTTFQEIAYQCLHYQREKRPTTKKVLMQLTKALEFQNMSSTMTKFAPLQIPLEDVVKATDNFHDDNIIGHDGFGTAYKGRLWQSGRLMKIVARRFDCKHGEGDLKFLTEISVLSDLKHTNLVFIIGFCDEKDEKIIITAYETNGSLGQYLNSAILPWTQRLWISVGVARALSYLHDEEGRDYAIIHCNINGDTVLLDENLEAKLSSFEFSIKQYHKDQVCFCEHSGTMGCVDPTIENTGHVTEKSDIYSFGVVLFEMLCGKKTYIQHEAKRFQAPLAIHHYENGTLQDIIHPDMWNQMSPQSLFKYSKVAYSCLKEERAHRPSAKDIVDTLEKTLESQLQHENSGKNFEHMKIRLADIKLATNDFSETYKFEKGVYYAWYRGELNLFDKENPSSEEGKNKYKILPKRHTNVIIRRIQRTHGEHKEQVFFTELDMLTSVKHSCILTLLGFCIEGPELIHVIENVSNGNLGRYLGNDNYNERRILTWERRLKICINVANALNYLHWEMEDQKMIILRDLRSHSIVLDGNWEAKIAWFGYSAFLPLNQEDDSLCLNKITRPYLSYYIDPEYEKTGKFKRASDVYSFGLLLLEILCGRLARDPIYLKESDKGLATVVRRSFRKGTLEDMIDPIIMEETNENNSVLNRGPNKDSLHTFIEIAHQCIEETQDQRPTMKIVVKELEKALFFQENNKDTQNMT